MLVIRENWTPEDLNQAQYTLIIDHYHVARVSVRLATAANPTPRWDWQSYLVPPQFNNYMVMPNPVDDHSESTCEEAMISCEKSIIPGLETLLASLRKVLT
jgi:hypothetical protein